MKLYENPRKPMRTNNKTTKNNMTHKANNKSTKSY